MGKYCCKSDFQYCLGKTGFVSIIVIEFISMLPFGDTESLTIGAFSTNHTA